MMIKNYSANNKFKMKSSDKVKNLLLDKTCDKCYFAMYICNDFSTTCEKWESIDMIYYANLNIKDFKHDF